MIETELENLFAEPTACVPVDVDALLVRARRAQRARRRRRSGMVGALVVLTSAFVVARPGHAPDRGDALTLTPASSPRVVVTAQGRVRFSNGMLVWRTGSELFIGEPGVEWSSLDTHHPQGAGGRDSLGTFSDGNVGVVTSIVHAVPRAVTVTLSGESRQAEIACFDQTPGWCVWAATFDRPLTDAETFSLSSDPPAHIRFTE